MTEPPQNATTHAQPYAPGPRSPSARNALKHGMTGNGIVRPHEIDVALQLRMVCWNNILKPFDDVDLYFHGQFCLETIRVEMLELDIATLKAQQTEKYLRHWDRERRIQAERLVEELRDAPARIVRELQSTPQGCDLMIERWQGLIEVFYTFSIWDDAQVHLALDLLGIPVELRRGCRLIGTEAVDDLANGTRKIKPDRAACWNLAHAQIEKLKALRETVLEEDAAARAMAAEGVGLPEDPEIAKKERLLRAVKCRQKQYYELLTKHRRTPRQALIQNPEVQPEEEHPPWREDLPKEWLLKSKVPTVAEFLASEEARRKGFVTAPVGEQPEEKTDSTPSTQSSPSREPDSTA